MTKIQEPQVYKRKITPIERLFRWSPFSIVTVVAQINGHVTEAGLVAAVAKVRQRHPNLRVRMVEDETGTPWFTSEGAGPIPVSVVPQESEDHWQSVLQDAHQVPFKFDEAPAVRFILLQGADQADLVIYCHHILCDGMSLAYLARDLLRHLGDPGLAVELLPNPVPITPETMPEDVSINRLIKFFIKRFNKKWAQEKITFDQEDYENLLEAHRANIHHKTLAVTLSEAETTALVERCRREGLTVNSALAAAFDGAHSIVRGQEILSDIGVAANLRDRLRVDPGEVMGFYAGVATLKHPYDADLDFWENARRLHKALVPLFTNKKLFSQFLMWTIMDPAILEAINFKKLGTLVPKDASRFMKLSTYSEKEDVVLSILKRDKMDSLDEKIMGTAVTNLGRLDFPRVYGDLELERLFMQPGGAFPLTNINLVLGAATCSGKLSLVIEYAEEAVDTETLVVIKDVALKFILKDQNNDEK